MLARAGRNFGWAPAAAKGGAPLIGGADEQPISQPGPMIGVRLLPWEQRVERLLHNGGADLAEQSLNFRLIGQSYWLKV